MAQPLLLLFEDSRANRPTADVIQLPLDSDPRTLIDTIRTKLLESTSNGRRFFNKCVLLQKPSAWVVVLPDTVDDLTAIPPLQALIQDTTSDKALSEAINDPDSPGHAFYKHMYALYKDAIFDFDEKSDTIVLPQKALVVRYHSSPKVKRVVTSIVSAALSVIGTVVGGGVYEAYG